jgi:16S rRNA (uracil1498-N3)-methyltransferase
VTPPLFLVAELGSADTIVLTGPEAHHAGTVKRLSVGELTWLADGRGGLAEARVASVARERIVFTVTARRQLPEPEPRFVVVQALPKGERADLAVEVLTELGVDEILPWSASRSVTVWKGERAARGVQKWQRTAQAAAKQSRRPRVPVIADLADTATVARRVGAAVLSLVLHEDADDPLAAVKIESNPAAANEVVLVVGPEGGLSPEELTCFAEHGARAVRLGAEVLRTSTAGAAALAVLSVAAGRWR